VADYKVKISYDDQGTGKKVEELDKKIKSVAKNHKVSFSFPDLGKVKKDLQEVGQYAGVAAQAFKAFTPVGRQFAEIEENARVLAGALKSVGTGVAAISRYANPAKGISDGFTVATVAAETLVRSTANIGFAIFGVTQSLNVLKAAFGGFFNDTVGREVRLRETILQTSTSLAGTNRVLKFGVEIEDPTEKLKALEAPINASIERLRDKSLEIAGTTSEAVIQTFNIIAAQIGNFGGSLKDAEQLAVQFAGALGTLGMSNPMYARQEVGSILMGYVDNNSILAKTLGITNADIEASKKKAGGLVGYLNEKLKVFEAGQKIAAKGFAGITSNLQELQEEMKRAFGASLLDPIIKRLDAFYSKVSGKSTIKELLTTSRSFGQLIGSSLNSAVGIVGRTPALQSVNSEGIEKSAKQVQEIFVRLSRYIQQELARIAPAVQTALDNLIKGVGVLATSLGEMFATLGRVKIDQIVVQLQLLSTLTPAIVAAAKAYEAYLKALQAIINTPLGRYLNELKATFDVLKATGATSLVPIAFAIKGLWTAVPKLIGMFKAMGEAIGEAFVRVTTFISGLLTRIVTAVTTTITAVSATVIKGISTILAALARLAASAEVFLNSLSTKLALGGGYLSGLAAPIAMVSRAFGTVAVALEKCEINATEFEVKIRSAMTTAQVSSTRAAGAINTVGTSLKKGAAEGAKAAGSAVLGLGMSVVGTMLKMAAWTFVITAVLDGLRRLSEWWDGKQQDERLKMAVDKLENGLLDQVKAAKAAGKELDPVLKSVYDDAIKEVDGGVDRLTQKIKEQNTRIAKAQKSGKLASGDSSVILGFAEGDGPKTMEEMERVIKAREAALSRVKTGRGADPELVALKKGAEYNRLLKIKKEAQEINGEDPDGLQLKARENRQEIKAIADFEKAARRSVEDEIYNYRRQIQSKEIDLWRQEGQLRIAQIDAANRRITEGARADAREALSALANWISTKKRGEMDIEGRKREAQITLAELERNLGRFRENLEKQILDIRSKIGQYEIDVLDKRIKGEQLIANIRNGSVVWESSATGAAGGLAQLVGRDESFGGNYAAYNTGGRGSDPEGSGTDNRLLSMTVAEIMKKQANNEIHAVGKYQIIKETLAALMNGRYGQTGVKLTDKYDPATQDKLFTALARARIDGKSDAAAMKGLREEWHGLLKASNTELLAAIKEFRTGAAPTTGGGVAFGRTGNVKAADGYGMVDLRGSNRASVAADAYDLIKANQAKGVTSRVGGNTSGDIIIAPSMGKEQVMAAIEEGFRKHASRPPKGYGPDGVNIDLLAPLNTPVGIGFSDVRDMGGNTGWGGYTRRGNLGMHFAPGGKSFHTGAGGAAPATAPAADGSAGIGAVGGAPGKPNVTLNIDTSGLDSALTRLKDLNAQLLDVQQRAQIFANEEAFQGFIKGLDKTSEQFAQTKKSLEEQELILQTQIQAVNDGITDPKIIEQQAQYALSQKLIKDINKSILEGLDKMTMAEQDRAKARQVILDQHNKDLANTTRINELQLRRLTIERDIAATQQMNNDKLQIQTNLLQSTFDARSQAFLAALPEDDFLSRRRMEAQRSVYSRYLDYSKGGTQELTGKEQEALAQFAEQSLSAAEALAALDKELNGFAERLQLAREAASTITEGFKGMVSSVLKGGDIGEAATEMAASIADRFTNMFLDYAFKPLEKQLEKLFGDLFGVDSAQDANTTALGVLTTSINALNTSLSTAGALSPALPEAASTITEGFKGMVSSATRLNTEVDKLGGTLKEVPAAAEDAVAGFQKTLGGIASLAAGAMAIYGGISQMGKGGTYNTLTGLAGVFAGIGGLAGGFAPGGGLAGLFRADGGPVSANRPYIVGERGPELFMSATSGTIIPNHALPFQRGNGSSPEDVTLGSTGTAGAPGAPGALGTTGTAGAPGSPGAHGSTPFSKASAAAGTYVPFSRDSSSSSSTSSLIERSNRETIQAIASAGSLRVEVESQVINGVEYITADQHRRGMEQAANRGRDLTLSSLQNSLRSRRRIGL
jgi:hypothetical protein